MRPGALLPWARCLIATAGDSFRHCAAPGSPPAAAAALDAGCATMLVTDPMPCCYRRGAQQIRPPADDQQLSADPDNNPPRSRLFLVVPKTADPRIVSVSPSPSSGWAAACHVPRHTWGRGDPLTHLSYAVRASSPYGSCGWGDPRGRAAVQCHRTCCITPPV
jgi:hypothetical protein